ncbi:hypothetical protein Q2T76_06035 [Lactobacillus sp. YT155]|uniref:hypothetical protein n=1 Tax=Lactobacillus sp. YT155 TaxID=3060955 RepID=UPI00265F4CF7|nr:hypothetical protein [Lactobacillus sp. YT155]MDO1605619.1 hypothetical protein [Lactobacillus sp. YT155]
MRKKLLTTLAFTTTLVAASVTAVYFKHKSDSQKVISFIESELGDDIEVISSWSEPMYQRVNVDGRNKFCLVGGINVISGDNIVQYHFLADALSGELLDLKKAS